MLVAIDTGGTKTLVASFNNNGELGKQIKFPTPKDPAEYTRVVRDVLLENYFGKPVDAIILAVPGVVKDGVAVWCHNLGWKNFDVAKALRGSIGKAPVYVENDANMAGLAETRMLKTKPAQSLYVTISTGIGTGIITDGHINQALKNSEGGHALVEFDGSVREWEDFASGAAIFKTYKKYAHDITSVRVWNQIADRISRGFLAIIPILQPDTVIIGGSIGTYFDRFGKQLHNILKEKLPDHIPCPTFLQAKHPELAVIYGCYYYAIDNIDSKTTKK